MTFEQLATLLGKDHHYLRNKHLSAMLKDGDLVFLYPESYEVLKKQIVERVFEALLKRLNRQSTRLK